ncbi:AfsR/SARP family transcriptional regulator [Kibdelosporangium aridum]|uniref:AfsR/SARP family transcriptional regulator n=1 Tax=Kibdelosporangium aridum TaxID=2030 RepID=UPI00068ACCCD
MEIRCLGEFSFVIGGRPVRTWRAGKARSLFQYLLVNRDRFVSGNRLCEVLWPGRAVSPRSSSLKVAMHAVRKILAAHQGFTIEHENGHYRLTARDVVIDFEQLARYANTGQHQRVAELYTGDFLPGDHADWVVEHREWCKTLVLHSLRQISTEALRDNHYSRVIEASKRMVEIDPCAEGAYQTLMIMHARLGHLGRVHAWYRLCARRLRTELDVQPTRLTRRILAGAMRGDLRAAAA